MACARGVTLVRIPIAVSIYFERPDDKAFVIEAKNRMKLLSNLPVGTIDRLDQKDVWTKEEEVEVPSVSFKNLFSTNPSGLWI